MVSVEQLAYDLEVSVETARHYLTMLHNTMVRNNLTQGAAMELIAQRDQVLHDIYNCVGGMTARYSFTPSPELIL